MRPAVAARAAARARAADPGAPATAKPSDHTRRTKSSNAQRAYASTQCSRRCRKASTRARRLRRERSVLRAAQYVPAQAQVAPGVPARRARRICSSSARAKSASCASSTAAQSVATDASESADRWARQRAQHPIVTKRIVRRSRAARARRARAGPQRCCSRPPPEPGRRDRAAPSSRPATVATERSSTAISPGGVPAATTICDVCRDRPSFLGGRRRTQRRDATSARA